MSQHALKKEVVEDESLLEGALAFARTLKGKSLEEACGQLCAAFNMTVQEASTVMLKVRISS